MCSRIDCANNLGKWVQFQTQWGSHRGIVAEVNNHAVLIRVPRRYAPMGLVNNSEVRYKSDEERLDLALAQWGGWRGYGGPGYRPYGARWGYPGYGAWWGGWWWWWLAFAWIFWLAFLW